MLQRLLKHAKIGQDSPSTTPPQYAPCEENRTMLEAFEWYSQGEGRHWAHLTRLMPLLKSIGIDNAWLPPGCKAGESDSIGYDIYDHFDLGEFDQKGIRRTKWGTKEELVDLCAAASQHGIGIYWDAIFNHKAWADRTEVVRAVRVNPSDRTQEVSRPQDIEAWIRWDFSGRNGAYSSMRYDARHFNGIDFDQRSNTAGIFKLVDSPRKGWAKDVDKQDGNADYLLCSNYDLSHPDVRGDLKLWGNFIANQLPLAGIRFDAVKHYSEGFLRDWIEHMDRTRKDWFLVGEYCKDDLPVLTSYIKRMNFRLSLFDFPLHSNLVRMSCDQNADLREAFNKSLTSVMPANAVTFVTNHDTQEREQTFETRVKPSFQAHAHAIILLRKSQSYPCVFYGDLFGTSHPRNPQPPSCGGRLPLLVLARKLWAYGDQYDYFDERSCIGWTRSGHPSRCGGAGLAVLLNISPNNKSKRMFVGIQHAQEVWIDVMGGTGAEIIIQVDGFGLFKVLPYVTAVWINQSAAGRQRLNSVAATFYQQAQYEYSY